MLSARHARAAGWASALAFRAAPGQLVGYTAVVLVSAALPVAAAWLMKLVLDAVAQGSGSEPALVATAAGLAGVGMLVAVAPRLAQYLQSSMRRRVARTALARLYTAVNALVGLDQLESPTFLDRLRLAQQSAGVTANRVVESLLGSLQGALVLAGFLVTLVAISPPLAAVVVGAAGPALVAELVLSRRRARLDWTVAPAERREMFYSLLLVSVEAAREIRLFSAGRLLVGRMLAERRTADDARQRLERGELAVQAGLELAAAAVAGGGLVWAAVQAWQGQLTVGDVSILVAAVAGTQAALASTVSQLAAVHEHVLLFEHYLAVVAASDDAPAPGIHRPVPRLRAAIEFRDVWFRYAPDQPWVLRGVDLTLPKGAAVALVGHNGAGKSTIVKLLCRFYRPTRGSIRWDGTDLETLDPAELRDRIGAVFQDYMAYDLTAADNVGIGDPDAIDDRSRVVAAAERAGVHALLEDLPRGYATMLSRLFLTEQDRDDPQTGMALSGGQWQRVATARGLMRTDPDLLILDEPSAGLDADAEYELHRRLRGHRAGRTSLLISHRLSAVRGADTIVVLAEGRVTETGTHEQLLDRDGTYARLFRRQAAGYQPVGSPS